MKEKYMKLALKEAKKAYREGEIPIGAVLVKGDKVIAVGHNQKEKYHSSLYHAELVTILEANNKLSNWRLNGCELYVTLQPCSMCASAIQQSRIEKVYYGTSTTDPEEQEIVKKIFEGNQSETSVELEGKILEEECQKMLQNFFKNRRK